MSKMLAMRSGGRVPKNVPVVVPYLLAIWTGQHAPSAVSPRTLRELRTIGEALDWLLELVASGGMAPSGRCACTK
eukprot:4298053-Amphidinium_carterae.1